MKETDFEKVFAHNAGYFNMRYYKITDQKYINAGNRRFHKEEKRPFDGVMVTDIKTYCIEFKIGSAAAKEHQIKNLCDINLINPNTGLIIRRFDTYIRVDIPNYINGIEVEYKKIKYESIDSIFYAILAKEL